MKKIFVVVLIMIMAMNITVNAKNTQEYDLSDLPENVKVIENSEIPEGIIPLKFDTIQEYKKYLKTEEKKEKSTKKTAYNDNAGDITISVVFPATSTTHSKKVYDALIDVYAKVNYTYRYDDYIGDVRIEKINYKYTSLSGMSVTHAEFDCNLFSTTITNSSREIDVVVAGTYKTYVEIGGILTLSSADNVECSYTINP